jgi:hypothetical protein
VVAAVRVESERRLGAGSVADAARIGARGRARSRLCLGPALRQTAHEQGANGRTENCSNFIWFSQWIYSEYEKGH